MARYNLEPEVKIQHFEGAWVGYQKIAKKILERVAVLSKKKVILAIESYPGVRNNELKEHLLPLLKPAKQVFADDLALDGQTITKMVQHTLTDDRVFGIMSHYQLEDFFPKENVKAVQQEIANIEGLVVVYGTGATVVVDPDILVYADLARWEIQCRYRSGEMGNWKAGNLDEDALRKFKRGYFFEWRMADRQKNKYFDCIDFLLDTNKKNEPKLITGNDFRHGLKEVLSQPFRVVPYFDASVWGGNWMEKQFELKPNDQNYGWAFDGVPEENSLYLRFGDVRVETPSINLIHQFPDSLLGPKVHSRFGTEFPIRFDYLDTFGGGNLSLQVHPLVEYIQDKFGMHYTQDESYYILEAEEDSIVYLGVKENTTKEALMDDLEKAENGNYRFPSEKHVNTFPVKKHDHILIPAGTIHCSGNNTVVLEISATPYIFTFKLWDWGRTGLDGLPRPVHLEHGRANLQMDRDTKWVKEHLINKFETIHQNSHHQIERTGLYETEYIETHRHWFTEKISLNTHESVNMLNLVEGEEAVIESPTNAFEPFKVHFGETFIVPAHLKNYTIRPTENSNGKKLVIIQAFVRNL